VAVETTTIKVVADTRDAERALGGLSQALAALGGISFVSSIAQQFVKIASEADELTNKLTFATGSAANANKAFGVLADTARRTGSNIGGTVDLFQKLAMSSTFAGSSTESLALITENFNKTLKISGTSGAGAAAALYQFAQAMQKGSLNGDEFRTIQETNGYLLKVLEQQTGKSRTELIQMASDGRLSAGIVGRALLETTKISQDFGKVTMGLPGAMENFSTSVSVAVKSLNDNLGITKLLASALGVMSENAGAVVGGIIGLTVAAVGLLAVMVPLATATAIATGGLTLLAAAGVGAAIGLAAQEAGVFADKTKDATKSQQQLNEEAKKGVKYTTQRVQQAIELDKSIQQTIAQLKAQNVIEAQGTGIRSLALEVEREVAKEREKYKKTGQAILPELERELAAETRKKILLEETNSTKRKFLELQSSTLVAGVQDAGQRQIINGLESFRLSVTVETYNQYKAQYQALLQTNLQAQALVEFSTRLRESQSQITVLSIKDLDVREQQSAVDRERLRLGILFTSEMESQVRASVQNAQAARDMLSVEQARRALSGTQTFGENVQRGVGVQQRMNPQGNLDTQYKMDMDALKVHLDNKLIAEDEYQNQLLRLKSEYANRSNELFIQQIQIERDQRQTSMQAEQQRLGKTQEQAKTYADFMMKTEEQKTQFALESAGQMFSALGAQNKKAFEAAKAFNIANAIMNTYMAATKAMASYPFPFSLIAAGAAVAMGLAQVAQIRAQTYSGRALGGPVMGGTPYLVGESGPELFTPNTTGSITRNQDLGGGGAVNVSFNIMANDTAGFDDLLLSRRGLIRSVISDAMLESGRRG
jgi:tape measure domain-containing protein